MSAHLLLAASLLFAAPPSGGQLKKARKLFEQGKTDYRNGQFQQAIEEFLAADKIKPAAALLYNVAQAYEKLGDQAKALEYYQAYLQRDPQASDAEVVSVTIQSLKARIQAAEAAPVVVVSTPPPEPVPPPAVSPEAAASMAAAKSKHGHGLAIGLASAGAVAAAFAIVGAVNVASYQGTASQIEAGTFTGTFGQAQRDASAANTWGIAAIILGVVAVAGGTGAALTW